MNKMRQARLFTFITLVFGIVLAGCADFSKFSKGPIEVSIAVTDEAGNAVGDAAVILVGPETYVQWGAGDGVAHFDSVVPGNYVLVVDAPSGYSATQNIPIWGGKPASFSIKSQKVENLIVNPLFEDLDGEGNPVAWETYGWNGSGEYSVAIGALPFGNAAKIHTPQGLDGAWGQVVPVEKNTTYRMSGLIHAENFNRGTGFGAQYSVHEIGQSSMTPGISGDGWHYVSTLIHTGDRQEITVLTLVGGWGMSSGTFHFTGVSLVKQ